MTPACPVYTLCVAGQANLGDRGLSYTPVGGSTGNVSSPEAEAPVILMGAVMAAD